MLDQLSGADQERLATLAARIADWVVIAIFAFRSVIVLITYVGGLEGLGSVARVYLPVVVITVVVNTGMMVASIARRVRQLLRSPWFLAADLLSTAGLIVWSALQLPPGAYVLAQRDTFWMYILGTIGLWTTIHGARLGFALLAAGGVTQFLISWVSVPNLTLDVCLQALARTAWAANGFVVPLVVIKLAWHGAGLADAAALQAGQTMERVQVLLDMHDTVLQTLGQVIQRSGMPDPPDEARLREITILVRAQIIDVKALLRDNEDYVPASLRAEMAKLVRRFAEQGLRVEMAFSETVPEPTREVTAAFTGAVREALNNARRHAGVAVASVRFSCSHGLIRITIRDKGHGFDPATTTQGFGLTGSIHQRIAAVGGTTEIWSKPGRGTRIHIAVPLARESRSPAASEELSQATDIDALTSRALTWFVTAVLAYRIALSPIQVTGALANIALSQSTWFSVGMAGVLLMDAVVLIGILAGRLRWLLQSRVVFAVDVAIAAGLNVWTAAIFPADTLTMPGHDIVWAYTQGVTALWTAVRGTWAGLALVAGGGVLQLVMAWVNSTTIATVDWMQLIGRQGYLTLALVIVWMLVRLAREGARLTVSEGVRAGRTLERVRMLQALQNRVLRTLMRITDLSSLEEAPPSDRMREIRGLALAQAGELRQALRDSSATTSNGLTLTLKMVSDEFRAQGLRVELVTSELTFDPSHPVTVALSEAVREALTNVRRHAGAAHAVVRAASSGSSIEIVIRDQGRGFDPETVSHDGGLAEILIQRLRSIGGDADIWSASGRGTRIRLTWDRPASDGDQGVPRV
ncbi:sensor histidine kinase [Nonomuraea guangzhouensis]|uniref:histidine kinase n=1 Tax=Nonomuraea guangzhouensis TaxID=1291555 RepID=A0ABW4GSG4_9ACTN|nr:ATP-binding protein [Nonomuraea guangzhouensis]